MYAPCPGTERVDGELWAEDVRGHGLRERGELPSASFNLPYVVMGSQLPFRAVSVTAG